MLGVLRLFCFDIALLSSSGFVLLPLRSLSGGIHFILVDFHLFSTNLLSLFWIPDEGFVQFTNYTYGMDFLGIWSRSVIVKK